MCGIAGILQLIPKGASLNQPLTQAVIRALDEGIAHRGPDGHGIFQSEAPCEAGTVHCTLIHRRLSILDDAGGHQPMTREINGQTAAVVFNGCIYNHRELRRELTAQGETFHSDHSDTEVILPTYARGGPKWPSKLDGMFAIAIWDPHRVMLTLVRDRAGEKPLYWAKVRIRDAARIIVFASTHAALTKAVNRLKRELPVWDPFDTSQDELWTLRQWIHDGCGFHAPKSIGWSFSEGTGTEFGFCGDDFYNDDMYEFKLPERTSPRTIAGEIDNLIAKSVAERLDADVPLGLFLSGGIDSGLIAAHAKKLRPDIRAFTMRMPDADYDESQAAAETARHLDISHTILDCQPNPVADIEHLIAQTGIPLGDSSWLPTYWLARAAREHVKVALTGDGGDELFAGYQRHLIASPLRRYRWLFSLIPEFLGRGAHPKSIRAKLSRLGVAARGLGFSDLACVTPFSLTNEILQQPRKRQYFRPQFPEDGPRTDFESYLCDDLLTKVDTAAMSVALETRAPLLSTDLINTAFKTPLSTHLAGGQTKALLRQVAAMHLPASIVNAKKSGFAIPLSRWIRENHAALGDFIVDNILDKDSFSLLGARFPFHRPTLERLYREHQAGTQDHAQKLWLLAVLARWERWLKSL